MTSTLAQQLKKISLAIGRAPGGPKQVQASVLYSDREAADTDTQTIYSNAAHGLEQLARGEPRFFAYQKSLFSQSTLSLDRGQLTPSELEAVNKSITAFLQLLGPHFLSPGCFKVLEYLLRKYRIHLHNVEELIACGLPFHSTNQFVRLVQAAQLENSIWEFLKPMQRSGAALPRSSLVKRCLKDKALLRFICDMAKTSSTPEHLNRLMVSLYAVVLCELLVATPKIDEDVVRLLLPYLLHGVGSGSEGTESVSADYRAATHMILAQLCTVATLAKDFLEVLVQQIIKNAAENEQTQVLMLLCHVMVTQPQLTDLPKSVLKGLTKMSDLAGMLSQLQKQGARVQPLLQLLTRALCRRLSNSSHCNLLERLIRQIDLGTSARSIADSLLEQYGEGDEKQRQQMQQLLRALDAYFPQALDDAINDALQAGQGKTSEQATELSEFVVAALSGSSRIPLKGASATVAQAIDSPSAEVRAQAVRQLDSLANSESEAPFIRSALIRRLSDDSPTVVDAALSSAALPLLSASELAAAISGLLKRARSLQVDHSMDKAARKSLREVVKKALKVLVDNAAEQTKDQIAAELLNAAMAGASTKRVAAIAFKLAPKLSHPALAGLENALSGEPGSPEGTEALSEGKAELAAMNLAAVNGLAAGLVTASAEAVASVAKLADLPGQHLLLLALNAACSQGSAAAADSALLFVKSDWAALEGVVDDQPAANDDSFLPNGLPTPQYLETAAAQSQANQRAMLRRVTLGALTAMPPLEAQDAKSLFAAFTSLKPAEAFKPHLRVLVNRLSAAAPEFLAEIFGLPDGKSTAQEQILALELFAEGAFPEDCTLVLWNVLPRMFAALCHPAAAVRSAALQALENLPEQGDGLTAKQLGELVKGILDHKKQIEQQEDGLRDVIHQLLGSNGNSKAKSKKNSTDRSITAATGPALTAFFMDALSKQAGAAGLHSARLLVECFSAVISPATLLTAAATLTQQLLNQSQKVEEEGEAYVQAMLSLYTPQAAAEMSRSRKRDAHLPMELLADLIAPLKGTSLPETSAELRIAAAGCVQLEMFAAMRDADKVPVITALLRAASQDPSNDVRTAAHNALEPLPIDAQILAPLLQPPGIAPPTPSLKRSKRAKTAAGAASPPPLPAADPQTGDPRALLTGVLEFLQWKQGILNGDQLAQPLSAALKHLLAKLAISPVDQPMEDEEEEGEEDWATSTDYLIQLALNSLLQAAMQNADSPALEAIDLAAVVECSGPASSAATRNASLALLAKSTSLRPEQSLGITLQVIRAAGTSAQQQADFQSQQIAAAALKAVAPAWLAAGRGIRELVESALDSTQGLAVHQSLPLLSALILSLPQEPGLHTLLLLILERAASKERAEEDDEMNPAASREALCDLAALVSHQVSYSVRIAAFASLLEAALVASGSKPHAALPLLATGLVTTELHKPRGGTDAEEGLPESLQSIMQNGLNQLQLLGVQAGGAPSKQQRAAVAGVTKMLEALEVALPPAAYISSLLALLQSPQDSVKRRALRLFEASLAKSDSPIAAEAAMQFCNKVGVLLGKDSTTATKQAVLVAVGALATAHGKDRPKDIVAILPIVLAQVADAAWAHRSSALATIAAIVAALGKGVLPVLPRLVPSILSAADAATAELSPVSADPHIAAAAKEMEVDNTRMEVADQEGEEGQRIKPPERSGERHLLEAQAALAAVGALVDHLGQFLSPYLSDILVLLLRMCTLHTTTPAAQVATSIRQSIPNTVPERLLLPAIIVLLDTASKEGPEAVHELLVMAGSTVDRLTPSAAASHANALWVFLLDVLDGRRRSREEDAMPGAVQTTEAAAVQLLLKLTLKLSEAKFKPLFLRLTDWAARPPVSGESGPERQIVLFKVVNALADQLRGVFVPYYRYLVDLSVLHLGGTSGQKTTVSKRKRQKLAAADLGYTNPYDSLLRYQVVKALQKCFLYDRQGFLNETLFNRVLPPLVAQLSTQLSEEIVSEEIPEAERPEDSLAIEGLDVMGQAAVDALVQLAVTAGSDAMWKPLHHQVLMATRSEEQDVRRRGLEVVCQLVERLGEEYVVLLPEAMPFLAELLEDAELHIQNATRALLRALEELTGESLDEYLKL